MKHKIQNHGRDLICWHEGSNGGTSRAEATRGDSTFFDLKLVKPCEDTRACN